MDENSMEDWIDNQFRKRGWTESEIKSGHKYEKWAFRAGIGAILSIFLIGLPVGIPLMAIGLPLSMYHKNPGKAYHEEKKELRKEFNRRDKSGEPLWNDVSDDWWQNRLASPTH